jgi:peptidyl-tRNA hydrolase
MPSEAYVLQAFSRGEEEILNKVISACVEAIEFYLKEDDIKVFDKAILIEYLIVFVCWLFLFFL